MLLFWLQPAHADDKAKMFATTEKNFGRIIIDFTDRLDLPPYKITSNNGVLSITFDSPIDLTLPDLSATIPDYVTIARLDPDRKGIRLGLRSTLSVNHIEAGEQLFIDMMPADWQGLPPSLPPEVIATMAQRAKAAALAAEQERKAEEAKLTNPKVELHVGTNPTFFRTEFLWSADTSAKFHLDGTTGDVTFDWPVPVELGPLLEALPKQIVKVENKVSPDGSHVVLHLADNVQPRFYAVSNRDFILDIDIPSTVPANPTPAETTTGKALTDAMQAVNADGWWQAGHGNRLSTWAEPALAVIDAEPQPPITPQIETVGSTVRVTFPFDRATPAAVFRRGDTVWMLFDTLTGIDPPPFSQDLAKLAKNFTIVPSGDEQVVRLDLDTDRLATLGSEGKSWVLSLGDMLLTPTEPLTLTRRADPSGLYEMTADLGRPGRVHQFQDPVVGDTLTVVTAYPPARGIARDLDYVDFNALRSVHGLVIQAAHPGLDVHIEQKLAVIGTQGGLIVSPPQTLPAAAASAVPRDGFIDLASLSQPDPVKIGTMAQTLSAAAAAADAGRPRDVARLDLAHFYLANQFGFEAIGVLGVLQNELKTDALKDNVKLTLAAADVASGRPDDALPILDAPAFADEIDAQVWRTIARTDTGDYRGAHTDALAAEPVIGSYPAWVRTRFLLDAVRASIEANDLPAAERLHKEISLSELAGDDVSEYQLLAGRLAEAEGRPDEALDTYGQVIAADVRPTRAEAVYRTILVLDQTGRIDPVKATRTLAAEALLWRGNALEAQMDQLLADLYFRAGDYRSGLDTVKQTVEFFPSSPAMDAMTAEAQGKFEDLYLNGDADQLSPVAALGLFYDFRSLTPPGSQGDAMIRNLAQRLVKVDLLTQAADLLRYQIDNRLSGAARAQVATDLAVIDVANRNPQEALHILTSTALADLPPSLDRQRRLLQARALIDSNRDDLALDLLTPLSGRDADALRVEADWNAKYYEQAGSLLETMYSPSDADPNGPALNQASRLDIVKAAVAFTLASDSVGVTRIRAKFSDALAKSAEWPMFDYVTSNVPQLTSADFRKVVKAVSGTDTLDAFLSGYKAVYGADNALTPGAAAPADATTAPGA